jgi:hypothetical protein
VLKYDLAGNRIWEKYFGGTGNDELRSVIVTNDGLIAAVGLTEIRDPKGDGYFLKIFNNGDTVFTKVFGGIYDDFANDLVQKDNDDYIICGSKRYKENEKRKSYVYRITSTGLFVNDTNNYASVGDEEYVTVATPKNRNYLNAFIRNIPVPKFGIQANIFVTYPNGWEYLINSFGGSYDEEMHSIEPSPDGGYLITGWTESFNSAGRDVFMMKITDTTNIYGYYNVVGISERLNNDSCAPPDISYDRSSAKFFFHKNCIPKSIELLDLNGRIIYNGDVHSNFVNVDFENGPGMLIAKILYDNYFTIKKVIGL